MKVRYPWKLIGPWYRRETTGGPAGRGPSPIIQKYPSSDFVDMFLKEPQRSLKFVCEDFINRICLDGIYGTVTPANRQTGECLKLFLDAHSRFYLVVCELVCQAPGCPSVSRDQVCEAGFVVRRFRSRIETPGRVAFAPVMAKRNLIMAKAEKILPKQLLSAARSDSTFAGNPLRWLSQASESARTKKLQALLDDFEANAVEFQELALAYNTELVAQKWVANPDLKGTGSWREAEEKTPQEIDEEIYPLYPLFPDPADKRHSAKEKTFYFGVVPTFSGDLDENGDPKFDNESAHEIRCFVRRHKEGCPVKSQRGDCPGEIVWSEPTESYRLAAFLDPDGSGHKPINIRLPDLNDLKAQALRGPAGKGLNVKMNAPPNSSLNSVKNNDNMGMGGKSDWNASQGSQICFFSIPLITIVALFVLQIFLPIVVFLFGLWFLLKLKLCIPPSFSFDAQFAADLKAFGPDFEAGIDAEIDLNGSVVIGGNPYSDIDDLADDIKYMLDTDDNLPGYLKDEFAGQVDADFDTAVDVIIGMATDFSDDPDVPEIAAEPPRATDGLVYFSKVNPL